jgi:hypothetical protein
VTFGYFSKDFQTELRQGKMSKVACFFILLATVFSEIQSDDVFRFANTFGNHMVLQQAPKRANIWGYGKVGQEVLVTFSGEMYRSFITAKTEGIVCGSDEIK